MIRIALSRTSRQLVGLSLVALALTSVGCGRVASSVKMEPLPGATLKGATLGGVAISSKETNEDAAKINADLKAAATRDLQALLSSRGGGATGNVVDAQIELAYGNRALRYFVGYGAGTGWIHITISLKDKGGKVLYQTFTEAALGVGAWGGDMKAVAEKAVTDSVQAFGAKL